MKPNVRIYTTPWCSDCRRAKYFLRLHDIPFEEINIEEVPGAAERVIAVNGGLRKVPTFEVSGRFFHCSPYDPQKLAEELGLEVGQRSSPRVSIPPVPEGLS